MEAATTVSKTSDLLAQANHNCCTFLYSCAFCKDCAFANFENLYTELYGFFFKYHSYFLKLHNMLGTLKAEIASLN